MSRTRAGRSSTGRPVALTGWKPALILAAVFVLLAAPRARALDSWTWQDSAWEAGFAAAVVLDVGTTNQGLKMGCRELNPIVGPHPSEGRVLAFGLSAIVGHAAVSLLLPEPYRRIWQGVTLGLEIGAVGINVAHVGFVVRY